MYADKEYIIALRREIHEYPEIGFDLPKTISVVKRELDKIGVEYTERYGESSVVATINPEKSHFTIGIRADMDALLINEINDIPYKSKIPGQMHACGHDAHTAMLLGTAKALYAMRDKIDCRVKLLFQPSEEGRESGAQKMVADGVMEDIDVIIGLHVSNWLDAGKIGVCKGSSMASSSTFKIEFFGASAHATLPQSGKDALATAVRTYNNIQYMLTREISPLEKYVCSVGKLTGGTSQNIIADYALMLGTIRTFNMELNDFLNRRIREIAENTASEMGVRAEMDVNLKALVVYNNPYLSDLVLESVKKVGGENAACELPILMSSEDFSQYLIKKPGVFIRLGTRNTEKGCTTLPHNNDFMIDEDVLGSGSDVCVQFVLDNMNGIDMKRVETSDERLNNTRV
ncbi:MAG: amidohydrolase [Ruminococcaceae bacterium]|nr:amidohydrolase [Oscillospiraceae bacterium]